MGIYCTWRSLVALLYSSLLRDAKFHGLCVIYSSDPSLVSLCVCMGSPREQVSTVLGLSPPNLVIFLGIWCVSGKFPNVPSTKNNCMRAFHPRDRTKSNNGAPSRAFHGSSIVSIKDNRTFVLVAPSFWPCHPWLSSTFPVSRGLSLDESTHARPLEEHDHVTSPNGSYRLLQPRIGAVSFPCTSHDDVFDELSSLAFDEFPRPTTPAGPPMRRSHHAAQRIPLSLGSHRGFLEGICFLALEAVGASVFPHGFPSGGSNLSQSRVPFRIGSEPERLPFTPRSAVRV